MVSHRTNGRLLSLQPVLIAAIAMELGAVGDSAKGLPAATVAHDGSSYVLANGYVRVVFSAAQGTAAITSLKGDFEGGAGFGGELLAAPGLSLQARSMKKTPKGLRATPELGDGHAATVTIVSDGPALAAIAVDGVTAAGSSGAIETWSISLSQGARAFELNTTGTLPAGAPSNTVVYHSLYATPLSVFGFYPADGVVQMMNAESAAGVMPTNRTLERVYMLGGVNPLTPYAAETDGTAGSIDIVRHVPAGSDCQPGQVTMLVSRAATARESATTGAGGPLQIRSGLIDVVAGASSFEHADFDKWTANPFSPRSE
jgi:hypothetical protein